MDDTQNPAPGWYQDPAGPPGQLRYFDGAQWTEHRAAAQPPGQAPYPPPPYGLPQAPIYVGAPAAKTTPDGRPLASWGARLGAWLLDGLILGVLLGLLALPLWISVFRDQFHQQQQWQDAHPGQIQPIDPFWVYRHHWHELVAIGAIGLVIHAIYFLGFWRWKQATPGKLALGLRIEYRYRTDALTWAAIIQRWLVQYGVAVVYGIGGIFLVIDGLWPLWDKDQQALHEKWPKTNVVRTR